MSLQKITELVIETMMRYAAVMIRHIAIPVRHADTGSLFIHPGLASNFLMLINNAGTFFFCSCLE
jgi:hypothetical protein